MKQDRNEPSNRTYKVSVNPDVAFTIIYEDQQGCLLFSIEIGADPKVVFLNRLPSENGRLCDMRDEATKGRVNFALERIQAYFQEQGLSVELD